jgi:hypothetical protein
MSDTLERWWQQSNFKKDDMARHGWLEGATGRTLPDLGVSPMIESSRPRSA